MAAPVEKQSAEVFEILKKKDVNLLKVYLSQDKAPVDVLDENGMTPMQHAAYQGNKEACQMLLAKGADVNISHHDHGYSTLHFAALSGDMETCQLVLTAGAKAHTTNSVGRTAAQMAAFVGHHQCVAIINNFVPFDEIEYHTVPRGLEKEPKLLPELAAPLHKFIMEVNIHPVHVLMFLQRSPLLMEHLPMVTKVLVTLSEKEMKRGIETNELMALKFHLLSYVLKHVTKMKKELENKDYKEFLTSLIKVFLKGRQSDNIPEYLENFLRDAVKSFPYCDCTSFRQLVTNLAQVKVGSYPPTMHFITSTINGQRGFQDQEPCGTCGEEKAARRCSKCKSVQYCNQECQALHWFTHKRACSGLAVKYQEKQKEIEKENEKKKAENEKKKEENEKKSEENETKVEESELINAKIEEIEIKDEK